MTYWTIDSFLDHEFPPIDYLIDPISPIGGITLLHGQQTTGKSLLALGLIKAASEGGLLLKQFDVPKLRSLYIQMDLPNKLFQTRTRAIAKYIRGGQVAVVTKYGYHDILKWVKQAPDDIKRAQDDDPQLVVLDSVRRAHKGDENSSQTVTGVYGTLNCLFPNASLTVIHHENKDQPGPFKRSAASRPRGSGAWIDDADAAIGFERLGRGKGGPLRTKLIFTKVYATEEPEPIYTAFDESLLLLEPTKLTSRQYADLFVRENPEVTRHQLVTYLQGLEDDEGKQLCGESNAYKIAGKALQVGS